MWKIARKVVRKIVDGTNVTVTVLLGLYLIVMCFGSEALISLPAWLRSSWWLLTLTVVVGLLLVGLNILELYYEIKDGSFSQYFSQYLHLSTDQGRVSFYIPTLEMQLQRELKAEPDVVDPLVSITPHAEGKPLTCEVELKLRRTRDGLKRNDEINGLKRIDEIKKRVRDIIDRLISVGLTVDVLVDVRDFINEPAGSREASPDAGEFNGPVYADGAGSEGV